ncbi:MAG TPA: GspH/FimT family pseudopilin [Acidobacteriota bacterium]|nr:GspH/FimT family pseudopilin [Acidobacteriota bacterium]
MTEVESVEKDRGFSLAELCIMVSMMAILVSLSVPVASNMLRDFQLLADVRNIATSVTYAKLRATSGMTHYQLTFNISENTWSVNKLNKSTNAYEVEGDTKQLSMGAAHSGITFKSSSSYAPTGFPTSSSTSITFNSRGIPIDGGSTPPNALYISNAGADYAVTVSLSGKVQLWRYRNSQWTPQ